MSPTSSELAPNMFGASSELASVMEFGFNYTVFYKSQLSQMARATLVVTVNVL